MRTLSGNLAAIHTATENNTSWQVHSLQSISKHLSKRLLAFYFWGGLQAHLNKPWLNVLEMMKGVGRGEWALALARAASVSHESGLHTNPGRSVCRCSRRPWRLYHQTNVIDWKLLSDIIRQITAVNDPPSFFPPCFAPNALSLHHERFIYLFIFWGDSDRSGANNSWAKGPRHSCLCFSFALTNPGFDSYSLFIIPFVIYKNTSLTCIHGRLCSLHKPVWTETMQRKKKTLSISLPHMQMYAVWQAKTF